MNDANKFANLETLPNGQRFLRSVKSPNHGWFVESETETLPDGRQFVRHAADPDNVFIVEQRTIHGIQQIVAIGYTPRPL